MSNDVKRDNNPEVVDPVAQLYMSLAWHDDYTDEYKRRVITDAIRYLTGIYIRNV
jgi:hypothetical protein